MSLYMTDRQAAASGLDTASRDQVLADAGTLYRHVDEHPWIDETDLRRFAEQTGIGPDRVNQALRVLADAGKLHAISTPTPVAEPPAADELDSLNKDDLYAEASKLDIPGRSSMDKPELKDAIRQAKEAG